MGPLLEYIGTKKIKARPMTKFEYNNYMAEKNPERNPIPGAEDELGFLVLYNDSHESWSPAEAFKAYRRCDNMNFGLAVEAMKMGDKVTRKGWNRKGMWCEIQFPGENSKMTKPYIFITVPGDMDIIVPRTPVQSDMLADDWEIVE